ncbi:MAG: universal stress protein [Gammaproteobacteria bacterium]|nr:universal stress protein [Gammaproteobacteria bacterium]
MSYSHILIAVDFPDASAHVVRRAADIARQDAATMSLLHVVDYLPPLGFADDLLPAPALLVDEKELLEHGTSSLEAFARKLGLPAEVRRHVVLGAPHQQIVEYANTNGVDLIVLGSHGRHGLGRLLGSTANAVLNHAACDVLAVRIAA